VPGGLKPAVEVRITWSIHARLGDSVLGCRAQPSVVFEHNCDRVHVPGEVNEVLEFVNIGLYIPFALLIPIGFESHECCGCLILWAERRCEFLSKGQDVKHIFPDRSSCCKMCLAKLAACPPLKYDSAQ
jgi:hypothetical protein